MITIQGDPTLTGQGFLIQGGGLFLSPTSAGQNIGLLGADRAVLVGVTLTNPNPRGYGLWTESSDPIVLSNTFTGNGHDGISTVGTSAPLIQGNIFVRNGANGMTIFGSSRPQVRENLFEQTGFGINISGNAAPLILANRISQNKVGIVVQKTSRPVIRGNLIESSQTDGIAAIAQSQPNLGTVAEPGNNIFRDNARYDINATATRQIIPAFGNTGLSDRTVGQIDRAGTSPGSDPMADPTIVASVADQIPIHSPIPPTSGLINQLPPPVSSNISGNIRSSLTPSQSSEPTLSAPLATPQPSATAVSINIPVPQPELYPALARPPGFPLPFSQSIDCSHSASRSTACTQWRSPRRQPWRSAHC
ncbi:MAG: DUF1565 domain-containing protein [Leptolyngbyaceae cyanobacterium CRU_2_3]|nr:DUF1565 domain-containing protein [Leptolyngbyaceae cyanobacterium CRU_2_3]